MKKQCPICGEYVEENTQICPFCNENIVEDVPKKNFEKIDTEISENENYDNEVKASALNPNILVVIISLFFIIIALSFGYFLFKKYNDISSNGSLSSNISQIDVQPKQLQDNMNDVRKFFKDKEYEKAAKICEEKIESSQDPIAYFYLGRIYQEQNYTDLAIENIKKAANIKPDLFEAQFELGKIYKDKYEYDSALEYLNAANKLKKNNKEVLEMLVDIYYEQDNMEKCLEFSKQLIKLNSNNYHAFVVLFVEAINKNEMNSAIKYLKKALEINYNTSDAIFLAKLYMQKEQYTNAINILDKIIDEDYYNYEARNLKEKAVNLREDYKLRQEYKQNQQQIQQEIQNNENYLSY